MIDQNMEALVTNAIKTLLTTRGDANRPSPVEKIAAEASQSYVRLIIVDLLQSDEELKANIKSMLSEALHLATKQNREKMIKQMAADISRMLMHQCETDHY